jgi:hypothetical protein
LKTDGKCPECEGYRKCKFCQGNKLNQIHTERCPNCANWSESYRSKVPCHRCKDTKNITIKTCSFCGNKGLCNTCKGSGVCNECKGKGYVSIKKKLGTKNSFNPNDIIGTTIKLEGIEVAQFDFPNKMTVMEAITACKSLGQGWRLPSGTELMFLYENKNEIGGFNITSDGKYCSMPVNGAAKVVNFWGGYDYNDLFLKSSYLFRAVKTYY